MSTTIELWVKRFNPLKRIGSARTVFPFRLHLYQNLRLAHHFDDFTDITSGFMKQLEFFS